MASVDVPVALLGYGTVGSAVDGLLRAQASDIERATGHRLTVVRALVRDPAKDRGGVRATTDFADLKFQIVAVRCALPALSSQD